MGKKIVISYNVWYCPSIMINLSNRCNSNYGQNIGIVAILLINELRIIQLKLYIIFFIIFIEKYNIYL